MQLSRRDVPDLLRSVGGVLFVAGAVTLLIRKSGHHGWGEFALLLVALVPAVVLYVLALGGLEPTGSETPRPWQSVLLVAAILLWPVALFELLHWAGASTRHVLYGAGVFALTALLAGYAARRARVPYAVLLAGLASLVAWLPCRRRFRPIVRRGLWLAAGRGGSAVSHRLGKARARRRDRHRRERRAGTQPRLSRVRHQIPPRASTRPSTSRSTRPRRGGPTRRSRRPDR